MVMRAVSGGVTIDVNRLKIYQVYNPFRALEQINPISL
jgi:hypothetical protein